MESKYESKHEFDEAVLKTAVGAPLKSSYIQRRMSAFSDDPVQRRLQAAVRLECLQLNKTLMKQRQVMLSTKQLSRRKQKKLEAVDKVGRLASFMDISREEAQRLMNAKKEATKKESREQEARESRLEETLNRVLAEVKEMKSSMNKEEKTIIAKMDEIERIKQPRVKKVTFTEQTQNLFEDLRETNTVFNHMGVIEAGLKFGLSTLQETANVIGFGNYNINYIETFYDFVKAWSKSIMTALKDLLIRPAGMGFKLGKIILSVTDPAAIPGILWDMLKDLIFFLLGFAVVWFQFEALSTMVVVFDLMFGTNIRSYVIIILKEYSHFCYTAFMDGLKLIPRIMSYVWYGPDPDLVETKTVAEILRSDERLFYIATSFIEHMKSIVRPLINEFKNDKWIKPLLNETSKFFGSVYQVWLWLKESAGIVVEVVINVAKAGGRVVVDLARAIGDGGAKLLEAGNIGDIPGVITSGVDSILGSIKGLFTSTYALGAPGLRPHTVLTACGVLGITKSQFDKLQNQQMVKYANNNPLNDLELIHVVYHANKELTQPNLRF